MPVSNVNDGIKAVRQVLDQAWIDETHCERGLNGLREYRREWSDKLQTFANNPRHDASSHAADTLRTFACGFRDVMEKISLGRDYGRPPVYDVGRGGRAGYEPGTGWMRR